MDAEVCIVGAGAAGGIMAAELAQRGVRVIVLESGPRHDFSKRREYVRRLLRHEDPWQSRSQEFDRYTTGGPVAYGLGNRRARGIGGSSLHWEGYTVRMHPNDFRLKSLYGIADDWPISYADLEPYYVRAERTLGIAGIADDPWGGPRSAPFPLPEFPFSYSDQVFARACGGLGIAFHHMPQARNSVAYGGRARCQACSTCYVCPTGAKASIDLTHIPLAEASGHARIVTDATVLRLVVGESGDVTAAIYAGADSSQQRVTARVFVVAAGAIENVRLLLLSTSNRFPDGLANRSRVVGNFFMSHPSIDVTGRVAQPVYPYRIGFSTAMSRQFAVERDRATRGAFLFEFLNSAGPTPERLAVASRLWGEELRKHVREEFGHRIGIRVYCEQLPQRTNAVSIDTRIKDPFGNPVPHIRYSVGRYERAAIDEAREVARKILMTIGAVEIRAGGMSYAAHQIGTHRMGMDPHTSVVDMNLRAHDVPNLYLVGSGAFVTASSSPPTLTIAALAIRAVDHIVGRLRPAAGLLPQAPGVS